MLLLVLTSGLSAADPNQEITSLFNKTSQLNGEKYWSTVYEIQNRPDISTSILSEFSSDASPKTKIAASYGLYLRGEKNSAISQLMSIIQNASNAQPAILAAKAIWKLTDDSYGYGNIDNRVNTLKSKMAESSDPLLKIHLSKAIYGLSGFDTEAIRTVEDQLNASDKNIQLVAALSLVQMEEYEKAKGALEKWSHLPTPKGNLAKSYLKQAKMMQDMERIKNKRSSTKQTGDTSFPVLSELKNIIQKRYVDYDKLEENELTRGAAEGMVNRLDRFSEYLTEKEHNKLTEDINLQYGGIGAVVSMRDNWLTIEQPIYSGPAYKVGLRTDDQIVKVKGESTKGKSIKELVKKLKGKPGTEVDIKVMRRGWVEPRSFSITREKIEIDSAKHRVLPGKIGYLKIRSFGGEVAKEVQDSLKTLKEKGIQSLILDLRGNPGGYLKAARQISDVFLPSEKMVVSIKGNGPSGEQKEHNFYSKKDRMFSAPVSVLVNQGSASASEIVSGALQDYQRGTVIGQRTYGKGSVQHVVKLDSTNQKAAVKITWAKYYLPSGRSIHKAKEDTPESEAWGIKPDIKVDNKERDFWFDYASAQVRESKALKQYWKKHKESDLQRLTQLARDDGRDWRNYPGFNALYKKLDTKLDKDNVRKVLRLFIRRKVADIRGKAFIIDYQRDRQLQRSILHALKKQGKNPRDFKQYKPFAGKFDDEKSEKETKQTAETKEK